MEKWSDGDWHYQVWEIHTHITPQSTPFPCSLFLPLFHPFFVQPFYLFTYCYYSFICVFFLPSWHWWVTFCSTRRHCFTTACGLFSSIPFFPFLCLPSLLFLIINDFWIKCCEYVWMICNWSHVRWGYSLPKSTGKQLKLRGSIPKMGTNMGAWLNEGDKIASHTRLKIFLRFGDNLSTVGRKMEKKKTTTTN